MEILEHAQTFIKVDDQFEFVSMYVVYESDGILYHAHSKLRTENPAEIKMKDLVDIIEIPLDNCYPLFDSTLTALESLPLHCFVKRPTLTEYEIFRKNPDPSRISKILLAEAKICEILKNNPHPNVAQYFGCEVRDARIRGLCFAKYDQTLAKKANPEGLEKRDYNGPGWSLDDCNRYMEDIEKGILHLHSLGLAHNNLSPHTIMFDDDDSLVIVDIDSCRPIGVNLQGVATCPGWFDQTVNISTPENDMDAICEIREWLSDKKIKSFQFENDGIHLP